MGIYRVLEAPNRNPLKSSSTAEGTLTTRRNWKATQRSIALGQSGRGCRKLSLGFNVAPFNKAPPPPPPNNQKRNNDKNQPLPPDPPSPEAKRPQLFAKRPVPRNPSPEPREFVIKGDHQTNPFQAGLAGSWTPPLPNCAGPFLKRSDFGLMGKGAKRKRRGDKRKTNREL